MRMKAEGIEIIKKSKTINKWKYGGGDRVAIK